MNLDVITVDRPLLYPDKLTGMGRPLASVYLNWRFGANRGRSHITELS